MNFTLISLLLLALETAATAHKPITRVTTDEPTVALTFDACATRTNRYSFDRAVFEVLRAENVPATIFVSGRWVEAHPDAMAELASHELIEFGDHSYGHPHMAQMNASLIAREIDQTEAALAHYGKKSVAFRPPFGEWSRRVLAVLRDKQLPAVLWDVVSGDPSTKISAAGITRAVLRQAKPGSIVVFHINGRGRKTAAALPTILRELRARGLKFVLLSTLLASQSPTRAASPDAPPSGPSPELPLQPDDTMPLSMTPPP